MQIRLLKFSNKCIFVNNFINYIIHGINGFNPDELMQIDISCINLTIWCMPLAVLGRSNWICDNQGQRKKWYRIIVALDISSLNFDKLHIVQISCDNTQH